MDFVLLTVRGTLIPKSIDAARTLHNETAGSAPGIAAARGLSDLSHSVFAPVTGVGDLSAAKPGELFFVDYWQDPAGLQKFFTDPRVGEQGAKLFASRDATVWMPAQGSYTFDVPAPASQGRRYLGVLRSQVTSPDKAIEAFRTIVSKRLRDARRRGQLSHHLFFRLAPPGDASPPEVIGLDLWTNLEGLKEHYSEREAYGAMAGALAGPPASSVWEQQTGFSEW